MKIMNQFVISALVLVPFGIPAMLYSVAENTPVEQRRCEMNNDVNFLGDIVTVRRCTSYGIEVSKQIWEKDDARLVCISNDPNRLYFYANEEDQFDQVQCAEVRANHAHGA